MRYMNIMLMCIVMVSGARAEDAATLRARAALAIAFAEEPVKAPSYAEQYAKAVREGKPLVVWVGQPAREVPGCVTATSERFPGADAVAVVVGVPVSGQLRRVDVPGKPTDATVRAALQAAAGVATAATLPVKP